MSIHLSSIILHIWNTKALASLCTFFIMIPQSGENNPSEVRNKICHTDERCNQSLKLFESPDTTLFDRGVHRLGLYCRVIPKLPLHLLHKVKSVLPGTSFLLRENKTNKMNRKSYQLPLEILACKCPYSLTMLKSLR